MRKNNANIKLISSIENSGRYAADEFLSLENENNLQPIYVKRKLSNFFEDITTIKTEYNGLNNIEELNV